MPMRRFFLLGIFPLEPLNGISHASTLQRFSVHYTGASSSAFSIRLSSNLSVVGCFFICPDHLGILAESGQPADWTAGWALPCTYGIYPAGGTAWDDCLSGAWFVLGTESCDAQTGRHA